MNEIKSLEELRNRKSAIQSAMKLREVSGHHESIVQVKVGMGTSGIASGAREIMEFFKDAFDKRNVSALVSQAGDMGYCFAEPTIEVTLPGKAPVVFGDVTIKKADEIIEKYVKNGEMLEGILPENYNTI
jgi:NADP-reducing hydrogenase subunit HndB